jgi:uncharacterized protein (TIGR02145 family)
MCHILRMLSIMFRELKMIIFLFLGLSLKSLNAQTVTDIDGNIYNTVKIGTQTWMAENLKVTTFNDGTKISLITDGNVWAIPSTPGYCWYNNDEQSYKAAFGALYNWFTLDTSTNGGRNVCPVGWHIPDNSEWTILTGFLANNGYGYNGNLMQTAKSLAASSGWSSDLISGNIGNNQSGNNRSGFAALPGGYRDFDGAFDSIGGYGGWWSSTEYDSENAFSEVLVYSSNNIGNYEYSKLVGFSVRCVSDMLQSPVPPKP